MGSACGRGGGGAAAEPALGGRRCADDEEEDVAGVALIVEEMSLFVATLVVDELGVSFVVRVV